MEEPQPRSTADTVIEVAASGAAHEETGGPPVGRSRDSAWIAASPRAGIGRLAATVDLLETRLRDAESTADARALVELGKGILMERLRCGPTAATRQLDELAARSGLPVLELAADLVNEISNDPLSRVLPARAGSSSPGTPGAISLSVRLRAAEAGVLNASDVHAAARSLQQQALEPLGAVALAIWALAADGSLLLAGHAGFDPAEARRWRHIPPRVRTPAQQAVAERTAQWVTGPTADQPPSIRLRDAGPSAARVALPAVLGGRLLGVLEICWPDTVAELPPQIHRQLDALAELCAHTLDAGSGDGTAGEDGGMPFEPALAELADGLLDSVLILRPLHDAEGRLNDFLIVHVNEHFIDPLGRPRAAILGRSLVEAYPLAAEDGGLLEKVERVHATGEPFRHRRMVLRSLIDQVPVATDMAVGVSRLGSSLALTWRLDDGEARLARLLQHAQRLGRIGGFEENLLTGEVTWNAELLSLFGLPAAAQPVPIRDLPTYAHPDDVPVIGRFLRNLQHHRASASAAFRLMRGDGVQRHIRIVAEPIVDEGTLVGVRGACQDISAQHWTEVALAATRDRLEHTEREIEESNRLALRLQRAIMPVAPKPIDALGLQIAARYRPAEKGHLVGGDWYDAVVLPDKRILLVVGDVAGHGIDAATEMVALRNALRGLAATGASPSQMLRWLNTVAHHMAGDVVTATAVCGVYDPDSRTLRWSAAGHPPPLLVRDGTTTVLPMPAGVLLGAVDDAVYEEEELRLQPDDVLLLYTDGLIERRDRSLDESLGYLVATARLDSGLLGEQLDRLLVQSNADTDDDTCLIGIKVG